MENGTLLKTEVVYEERYTYMTPAGLYAIYTRTVTHLPGGDTEWKTTIHPVASGEIILRTNEDLAATIAFIGSHAAGRVEKAKEERKW